VGKPGHGRSDAPMHVSMEIATAARSITAENAGATRFQLTERNEIGKLRRTNEAPAVRSAWMSHMERTIRQQPHELTQLH